MIITKVYKFYNEKILTIYLRICRLKPSGSPNLIYKKKLNSTTHIIKYSANRFYNLLLFTQNE